MPMAQKTIVQLVDDIDGKELADGEGETVTFSLDGTDYELDLSKKNADKFRGLFQDYIAAGRKTSGRKRGIAKATVANRSNTAEIRAWAKDAGFDVPDRGRLPKEVLEAFEAKRP